jgi:MFS family permease
MVTLATGLINSVMTMLLLRAAMGISESMYMPAAVSLTANAHAPHQRSRAVAILTTAQIAGTFAGALIGGTMAGWGQWRAAFFILGGLGLVYCVPYWIFLRSFDERPVDDRLSSGQDNLTDNRHDGPAVDQMRATIAVEPPAKRTTILAPSYLVLCVVFPIFVFGLWMIYAWLPNFLFEKFQLTLAGAAFVSTSSMQLSMLIGLIAGGFLADAAFKIWRSARQWLLVLSLVGCAPSLYFLGNSNSLLGTTAAATLFGLLGGVFAGNIFAASFEVVPSHTRASAVGWLNFFGAVLSGFAPLIGGAWKQAIGLERLLAATGVAYVLAAILLSASILTWYQRDYQRVH